MEGEFHMYYVAAMLAYAWFYTLCVAPFALATVLAIKWVPFLGPPLFILVLVLYVLALYRARLAAQAYGEQGLGFWDAHSDSGRTLRLHLTYLPLFGHWFEKRD